MFACITQMNSGKKKKSTFFSFKENIKVCHLPPSTDPFNSFTNKSLKGLLLESF